jgi:hypothetical protein
MDGKSAPLRIAALTLLATAGGCSRECKSPVPEHVTVHVRGTADADLRLVLMDDQWGTEDRTASVENGRYDFAWTGRDLTAWLGGERSFVLRAPADARGGEPRIVSDTFYLRQNLDVPLHLWRPRLTVEKSVVRFDPVSGAQHQPVRSYRAVVEYPKAVVHFRGHVGRETGIAERDADPRGTEIPLRLRGCLGGDGTLTIVAWGNGFPALSYWSGSVTVALPPAPDETVTVRGRAAGVDSVDFVSLQNAGTRTAPVGADGRYAVAWRGPDAVSTLGGHQAVARIWAGGAEAETEEFFVKDGLDLPELSIWNPAVTAEATPEGGLRVRFPARGRSQVHVSYEWKADDYRVEVRTLRFDAPSGEATIGPERFGRRTSAVVRVRAQAVDGRITYRTATISVPIPMSK